MTDYYTSDEAHKILLNTIFENVLHSIDQHVNTESLPDHELSNLVKAICSYTRHTVTCVINQLEIEPDTTKTDFLSQLKATEILHKHLEEGKLISCQPSTTERLTPSKN